MTRDKQKAYQARARYHQKKWASDPEYRSRLIESSRAWKERFKEEHGITYAAHYYRQMRYQVDELKRLKGESHE